MRGSLAVLVLGLIALPSLEAGGVTRKVLTSAPANTQVDEWHTKHGGFVIDYIPLRGGKQDGAHLLVIDNGKLKITILPERGMGILSVTMGDLRLGWDSPVKEVVHPKYVNLQARGGLGWLDGFNEWLVRCGLENNGQPGTDEFINNVGDKATMDLTLHGKIANIPASLLEVIVDFETKRATVRGVVHERMLFGPKLELATEITVTAGATTFEVKDTITNRGAQEQEFQLLYHANYGKPLLEEGATFVAPLERVTPFNANAARDVKTFNGYAAPKAGYIEQVYLLQPKADSQGQTQLLLRNKKGDRGTTLTYSIKELPYLTLWKNTGAEADGYVTGIEPGTNYPNRRSVERKLGRVPKLAGGQNRTFTILYGLHSGAEEVRRIAERIEALQGVNGPIIDAAASGK